VALVCTQSCIQMVLLYCTPVAYSEANNQFSVATVPEVKVADCVLQGSIVMCSLWVASTSTKKITS
jgi:hypothetical protein